MTHAEMIESIRRLIKARDLVYDDWVSTEDLLSIINDGVEPEHVAVQLGECGS